MNEKSIIDKIRQEFNNAFKATAPKAKAAEKQAGDIKVIQPKSILNKQQAPALKQQ